MFRKGIINCSYANFNSRCDSFRHVNISKDYYKILQVEATADQMAIKKSYHLLARKYHPDVNSNGHKHFTEIQQAYKVLSSEKCKKYYDECTQAQSKSQSSNQQNGNASDPHSYRNQKFYEDIKYSNYQSWQQDQPRNRQKNEQNQAQRSQDRKAQKRIDDEIELLRQNLFGGNPIWARANSYMSYQEKVARQIEKEKEMQKLIPGFKYVTSALRWLNSKR